jgi:hypothetical protein
MIHRHDTVLGPDTQWTWLLLPAGYKPECAHPSEAWRYDDKDTWCPPWREKVVACGNCGVILLKTGWPIPINCHPDFVPRSIRRPRGWFKRWTPPERMEP